MEESSSILSPTQRYATAALLALALHQSQIHQSPTLAPTRHTESASGLENPQLWIHENSGLLWPVFRFLGVDEKSWHGLEGIAGSSSQFRHHLASVLKILLEGGDATSSETLDKEAALAKAVDTSASNMNTTTDSQSAGQGQKSEKTRGKDGLCDIGKKSSLEPHGETKESSPLLLLEKQASITHEIVTFEQPLKEATLISYQRKVTVLYTLLAACVADTAAEADKKGSQSRQGYDARHRVALRLLAVWLSIKLNEMEAMESMVAFSLMDLVNKEGSKEEAVVSETSWDKWKRGGIIGAAAVTGGTLMAITGGLAAPAIAHGLGALAPTLGSIIPGIGAGGFAAAATATGSAAGSVAVAASFGAAGAGLTGSKMATRIGSLEEFELKEVGGVHQGHLAVRISISGLAFEEKDFIKPWEGLNDNMERYVLQYESKILIAVSTAVQDWLRSKIASELMKDGAMLTVLSSLVTALAWPAALLATFDFIDSRWAIAVDRSDKAGKVLAEVLLKGLHGNRPVTLVGFSLGARVIFKCLQCLAEAEGDNAGIVERVVLLGAPISIRDQNWEAARKMVAGRFVNAYSTNDWTLGITFRASLLSEGLAGIQPVDLPAVENVDVTQFIEGHSSYLSMTHKIVEQLDLDNCYAVFRNGREN